MWVNLETSAASIQQHPAAKPFVFLSQLHNSVSASIMRAQSEGIGRSVQEIEHEVQLLSNPDEAANTGGWGRLTASVLGQVLPLPTAKQLTVHLLKAHAETLRAAQSLCKGAVQQLEKTVPPPPPPSKHITVT